MKMTLEEIFDQFNHKGIFHRAETINSGHINATYLIRTLEADTPDYVMQKINSDVFKNIPELIQNKVLVTDFLSKKANDQEKIYSIQLIPTKSDVYYLYNPEDGYWNLMNYIPKSRIYLKPPNTNVAAEAGRLFGQFFYSLNDFEADKLYETIPRFHDMEYRLDLFEESLKKARDSRLKEAKECMDAIAKHKEEILVLVTLKKNGILPLRVTHNDTKLSNALFSEKGKGLAVIDLDTLMPGLVHYDFGDSVRTICTSAEEDEADLEKVNFLPENFSAFTKGFLHACKRYFNRF